MPFQLPNKIQNFLNPNKAVEWDIFNRVQKYDLSPDDKAIFHSHPGWVIDVMIGFMQQRLITTQSVAYVATFTSHERDWATKSPFRRYDRTDYDYEKTDRFIFQFTFVDKRDTHRVGVISIRKTPELEQDQMYVFFPFPDYVKQHFLGPDGTDLRENNTWTRIIESVFDTWENHARGLHLHNSHVYRIGFQPSNTHSLYFIMLMQKQEFDSVKKIYESRDTMAITRDKAINVYHDIGRLVGVCLHNANNRNTPTAKTVFARVIAREDPPTGACISRELYSQLQTVFKTCVYTKPMNNLAPVVPPIGVSFPAEPDEHPGMTSFIQTGDWRDSISKNFVPDPSTEHRAVVLHSIAK